MEDFNSMVDSFLDRTGNTRFHKKPSKIIELLLKFNHIDTYRLLNPEKKEYTWTNNCDTENQNNICTRIDFIWTSYNLHLDIVQAEICEPELILKSDHKIVYALLDVSYIIRNH